MGKHFGAESRKRARYRVEPRGVAAAQGNLGAEPGELKRDRLADAAPRAGDEHYLTGKQAVPESQRHRRQFFVRLSEFLGHARFASFTVCAYVRRRNSPANSPAPCGTGIG